MLQDVLLIKIWGKALSTPGEIFYKGDTWKEDEYIVVVGSEMSVRQS